MLFFIYHMKGSFFMKPTPITNWQLERWSDDYRGSVERQLATLALSRANLNDVAFVPSAASAMRQKFSVEIPTMPVTDQKSSGRCWLFAAANLLRENIAREKNLDKFELSQSFLAFWDKFERANYFLESIIATADRPTDDRVVMFVLQTGVHDGGQWDMFANIVRKYGLVPKDAYDETAQTGGTRAMNAQLNRSLKAGAIRLRAMIADGASEDAVQAEKAALLSRVYGFLCSCYGGEPPNTFDFETVDKDDVYHLERDMTPLSFRDKYVGDLLERIVSIINAPTKDKPFHKTFTISMLGNVVGGRDVKHLNLPMDEFKQAIIRQLEAGKIVWFGSDVAYFGDRAAGVWDDQSFNFDLLTGLPLAISKEDGLNYSFSAMNHAMVITGVNLKDGKPTRWKIENSWGEKSGNKGYYVCSDSWFDLFVYQAAVEREYLGDLAPLYDQDPVTLAPWDPMGTLAD